MEETLPVLDEVEVSAVAIYLVTGTVNDAAALRCEGGADCFLVGNSLENLVLSYDDFLSVTMELHERRRCDAPQRRGPPAGGRARGEAGGRGAGHTERGVRAGENGRAGGWRPRVHPAVRPQLLGRRLRQDERGRRAAASGGPRHRAENPAYAVGGGAARYQGPVDPHHQHWGGGRLRRPDTRLARPCG